MLKRCFFGISLPEKIKKYLFNLDLPENAYLRKVPKDNLHITLKFIGQAEPKQLIEKAKEISFFPFEAKLGKFNSFHSKIYFIEVLPKEPFENLNILLSQLFPPLDKKYLPHITLARSKIPLKFQPKNPLKPLAFQIKEFHLFSSDFKKYTIEHTFAFKNPK